MESHRLNDLEITIEKAGAAHYTKASYPVRYGKFCEIDTPDYVFQLNLSGEIKYIQGVNRNWPHPAESLKRTAANDWVFYSIAGYHQILDTLGEYYLPCLPYPTHSIWSYNPFAESQIRAAFQAWSRLQDFITNTNHNGLPVRIKKFFESVARNDAEFLDQKALKH
jgi:hypothetical protein